MIRGLDSFREWFRGYDDQYVIIGGTACDLLMSDAGLAFRATKDIDLVLLIEMVDDAFGKRFWEYVVSAGYEHLNRSSGKPQFYRFTNPKMRDYPTMIELFTRKPDTIALPNDSILSPLSIDDDISSLSAILLDNDYYDFLKQGRTRVSGVTVLDAPYLIPFKVKAWIDLSNRKSNGGLIDTKNIRKHKNDVFRLSELLDRNMEMGQNLSKRIKEDMRVFIERMKFEEVDLEQIGVRGKTKEDILEDLKNLYL